MALESDKNPYYAPPLSMSDTDKAAILIVDDRPEELLAFQSILEQLGQHLILAQSGAVRRQGAWRGETAFLARDGREFPVSYVIVAHLDAQGEPVRKGLLEPTVDEAAIHKASKEHATALEAMIESGLKIHREVDAVLTAEQIDQLQSHATPEIKTPLSSPREIP